MIVLRTIIIALCAIMISLREIIIGSKGSNHDLYSFVLLRKTITIIIGSKGSNHDLPPKETLLDLPSGDRIMIVLRTIIIGSKGSNHDLPPGDNYWIQRIES
jgi:hypothetical protein